MQALRESQRDRQANKQNKRQTNLKKKEKKVKQSNRPESSFISTVQNHKSFTPFEYNGFDSTLYTVSLVDIRNKPPLHISSNIPNIFFAQ